MLHWMENFQIRQEIKISAECFSSYGAPDLVAHLGELPQSCYILFVMLPK